MEVLMGSRCEHQVLSTGGGHKQSRQRHIWSTIAHVFNYSDYTNNYAHTSGIECSS